jgi:ATP-dependent helicase/nuclease subunit A
MVRKQFELFGDVLELVSNFRSRPPIERFVNAVFEERFPPAATAAQAAYAPMRAFHPDAPQQGVFWYRLDVEHKKGDDTADEDAECIASWIAQRISSGERVPKDFLILTRKKRHLTAYARALEARNVPVQVTGAGLGIETELSELHLLLEALADPADATLTLAALVGLFFGLDYEVLAEHVLDRGGRISMTHVPDEPVTDVERALARLNTWWRLARREPADVVVARIMDEQGLLPYAAGGPLGESRAGALLFVLDAVRKAALEGDATLAGALSAIEAALESEEAEAPLEPGRPDVLRLMNLHQAKGLEAPVVILAAPLGARPSSVDHCIARTPSGDAQGWTLIAERKEGWGRGTNIHAAPADWAAREAEEKIFLDAEEDRLLYVACTRAGEELLISRPARDDAGSPWAALNPVLDRDWPQIAIAPTAAPPRLGIVRTADELQREVAIADARRAAMRAATHRFEPVTARVKGDALPPPRPPATQGDEAGPRVQGRGTGWGIAVHAALEAAAHGASGDRLRAICRNQLIAAERPIARNGEPAELDELVDLVHAVATSDLWRRAGRAARSGQMLVEAPLSAALPRDEFVTLMTRAGAPPEALADPAPVEVIEGVVDLAFRDEAGWTLVDYKSDVAGSKIEVWRRTRYRAQVGLYAALWERITGEEVVSRVLLYTATGEVEKW